MIFAIGLYEIKSGCYILNPVTSISIKLFSIAIYGFLEIDDFYNFLLAIFGLNEITTILKISFYYAFSKSKMRYIRII